MIMKYYNSSDIRILKEQSMVMFEEVSSGVYYVAKDRMDEFPSYVTSKDVVEALNNKVKIAVKDSSGVSAYANFITK